MCDIFIVVISWNMRAMLGDLLDSVVKHTKGVKYEILVIDNCSTDGTAEMVRSRFPQFRLIQNAKNLGVAVARNQGFRIAQGRYVLTLDADMILTDNSLEALVRFMDKTPDAGVCGGRLVFPDGTLQPSARRFPTPMAFIMRRLDFLAPVRNSRALRNHEMAEWDRKDTRSVDYVIGACQLIRRTAMAEVGLLDEHIFYGPEDVDYCLRMHSKRWKVYYCSEATLIHYEQRATRKQLFSSLSFKHLQGVMYLFWKYKGKLRPEYVSQD